MTEAMMLYNELKANIDRWAQESDVTIRDLIGTLELLKAEYLAVYIGDLKKDIDNTEDS